MPGRRWPVVPSAQRRRLSIAANGLSVNYATTAGESLANVASGINAALAGAGISLSAQVLNGQQLELTSSDFGSAAAFSVTSSDTGAGTTGLAGPTAGTAASFAGTDVAGTINGVAATGSGQFLSAPVSDPTLGGLSLQISVSGITSSTDLGTFDYQPGIAQSLNSLTTAMSSPVNGAITLAAQGLTTQATSMNTEISFDQTAGCGRAEVAPGRVQPARGDAGDDQEPELGPLQRAVQPELSGTTQQRNDDVEAEGDHCLHRRPRPRR